MDLLGKGPKSDSPSFSVTVDDMVAKSLTFSSRVVDIYIYIHNIYTRTYIYTYRTDVKYMRAVNAQEVISHD